MVACRPTCAPIPWQLDERDASGKFVLDHGGDANPDDSPGVLDTNDLILFMASDAGDRVPAAALPAGSLSVTEIQVTDPRSAWRGWAYLLRYATAAPQSPIRYVRYDPAADRLEGARVALGFAHGTPRVLALVAGDRAGENLLDRMKIRASASFLWGLITVRRNEDDVLTLPVAWHEGPIRVVRRERFWIRLSWRWRTPIFSADTAFYRDFAEMPVTLHLNFRPRLLFADVAIRVSLDFRDLDGWELETPDGGAFLRVDGDMTADKLALARQDGRWFALHGPDVTLVQTLALSPSLRGVRPRLYYRESRDLGDPPESVAGALPEIGYTLSAWDQVASGDHWFAANAYALPREQSVGEFMDRLRIPLHADAQPLLPDSAEAAERNRTQ
ncbi:MAG TPA: hypothetical protein VL403_16945 [Candidatus Kryptonia bacterium]|nr:hypothetical protein [Candidatus Kryptonia bacterium]